jgi:hypothetical protein
MKLSRGRKSEIGFTRISVLLGVVLGAVCVLILGFAMRKLRPAAQTLPLSLPLQESLQDALNSFVRTKIVQTSVPCADPVEYFQSHLYLRTYSGSIGQARSAPPAGLSAKSWDELFHGSMAASSFAGVERNLKAPKDSFLHTPLIFAEVSIQLVDLKSGRNLSCKQYLDTGRSSAGATVEYLLFAINDGDERLDVMRDKKSFSLRR